MKNQFEKTLVKCSGTRTLIRRKAYKLVVHCFTKQTNRFCPNPTPLPTLSLYTVLDKWLLMSDKVHGQGAQIHSCLEAMRTTKIMLSTFWCCIVVNDLICLLFCLTLLLWLLKVLSMLQRLLFLFSTWEKSEDQKWLSQTASFRFSWMFFQSGLKRPQRWATSGSHSRRQLSCTGHRLVRHSACLLGIGWYWDPSKRWRTKGFRERDSMRCVSFEMSRKARPFSLRSLKWSKALRSFIVCVALSAQRSSLQTKASILSIGS